MGGCTSCTKGSSRFDTRCQPVLSATAAASLSALPNEMEVLRSLGKGGEGETVLARDDETGELYAIKCIARSPHINVTHITAEIRIQSNLHHTNVVALHEVVLSQQHLMLKLQYVPGVTMAEFIKSWQYAPRSQRPSEMTTRFMFRQLLASLRHCHAQNVAHRDVKLSNVIVDNTVSNQPPKVMLCDFGLSMDAPSGLAQHQAYSTVGTRQYMPFEVLKNQVLRQKLPYSPEKMDVWALGVVLFSMIAGRLPFLTPKVSPERKFVAMLDTVKLTHYALCKDASKSMFAKTQMSSQCMDLIKKMMILDYKQRIDLHQVAQHPWTQGPLLPEHEQFLTDLEAEAVAPAKTPPMLAGTPAHKEVELIVSAAQTKPGAPISAQLRADLPVDVIHTPSTSGSDSGAAFMPMLRWIPPTRSAIPLSSPSKAGACVSWQRKRSISLFSQAAGTPASTITSIRDESFEWSGDSKMHMLSAAPGSIGLPRPATPVSALAPSRQTPQCVAAPS